MRSMKPTATLKRFLFPHKAWPYPRTIHEVHEVILITGMALLLTLAGIIIAVKYQEQKTLSRQDLKYSAQNLTSSASELLMIARDSDNQPLAGPYRDVYLQQLATSVETEHDKLANHQTDDAVKPQAATLLAVSEHLSQLLNAYAKNSSDETLSGDVNQVQTLLQHAKNTEEAL